MRTHGNLIKWNDDRGFGFIAPAGGGDELFVHISAFPRDGQRPTVGELVSFDVETGTDGKPRAVDVMRPGQRSASRPLAGRTRPERSGLPLSSVLPLIAIVAIIGAAAGYAYSRMSAPERLVEVAPHAAPKHLPAPSPYSCDGRTMCSQMNSCAEATYFIKHCPGTQMDGDGDGVPCEQQWCG